MKAYQFNFRSRFDGKWYVPEVEGGIRYLHKDGLIRQGTCREDGEYTGYYDTEAEANAAIAAFQSKDAPQ